MSKIKDGGPAFPITGLHNDADFNGMTLRDCFAAKAMQGILIHQGPNSTYEGDLVDAKTAYRMADAMLAARTQEPKP